MNTEAKNETDTPLSLTLFLFLVKAAEDSLRCVFLLLRTLILSAIMVIVWPRFAVIVDSDMTRFDLLIVIVFAVQLIELVKRVFLHDFRITISQKTIRTIERGAQ